MNFERVKHDVSVHKQRWAELPGLIKTLFPLVLGAVAVRAVYKDWRVEHQTNKLMQLDIPTPLPPE